MSGRVIAADVASVLLWCAYPEKSSQLKTGLPRGIGCETLSTAGLQAVAQVAVDEIWAATRFRCKA